MHPSRPGTDHLLSTKQVTMSANAAIQATLNSCQANSLETHFLDAKSLKNLAFSVSSQKILESNNLSSKFFLLKAYLRHSKGFTILEVMVTMVIIGLIVAVAIPSFQSLSGTRVRSTANQFVGLIQDIYNRSVLGAKVFRLVIDLERKEYWVEYTAEEVLLDSPENSDSSEDKNLLNTDELQNADYLKKPAFFKVEEDWGKQRTLPAGVIFFRFWADDLRTPTESGTAYLYFYPTGYVQKASISLAKDRSTQFLLSITTEPLTGEANITSGEVAFE